ncbi:hypothetical protein [Deinococcus sonorensis]|uniref:Lipoprotein n=2 Tax=Deinococcus sonorensis TaxID=309891 RepID=A0AAU7U5S2_9DEIO
MRFLGQLSALTLMSALLLTACGSTGPGTPTDTTGATFTLAVEPDSLVGLVGERTTVQIVVTPQNGFTGEVTATLVNPPAGVTAAPVHGNVQGATTLTMQLQTGGVSGVPKLNVVVSGKGVSKTSHLAPYLYRSVAMPTDAGCDSCQLINGATTIHDGTYWMTPGPTTPTGTSPLIGVNLATGAVQTTQYPLGVSDDHSGLTFTQNKLWMVVNNGFHTRLLGVNPKDGSVTSVPIGDDDGVIHTLDSLVALPDQRLAFHYSRTDDYVVYTTSIGIYSPADGSINLYPWEGTLWPLTVAPDGQIWAPNYTDDGTRTTTVSLVRFNPTTHVFTSFDVGSFDSHLSSNLAITKNGDVWSVDERASTIHVLHPASKTFDHFNFDTFSRGNFQLFAAGDAVFLRYLDLDSFSEQIVQLSAQPSGLKVAAVPTLGPNKYLSGVAVGADGSLAYENGGKAYLLPSF